jgi:hypothetical protein
MQATRLKNVSLSRTGNDSIEISWAFSKSMAQKPFSVTISF